MVMYKVHKDFKDIYTGKLYKKEESYNFSVKRANEIKENLDSSFLTRKDEKKK